MLSPKDHELAPSSAPRSGITLRAFFIGGVASCAVGLWATYTMMVTQGTTLALAHRSPISLFVLMAVIALVNLPLRRIKPNWMLNRKELAVIYCMIIVSAALPLTRGQVQMMPATTTAVQYLASPVNNWARLMVPHANRLSWMAPQGESVIDCLWEGLPPGAPVPWLAWALPVLSWLAYVMVLAFVMLSLMTIFRAQWTDHERLPFPMVQAPLALIEDATRPPGTPSLWRNKVFLFGLLIPVMYYSQRACAQYWPGVMRPWRFSYSTRFLDDSMLILVGFCPFVIGLFYFVRLDVLNGLWLFCLLGQIMRGVLKYIGADLRGPAFSIWPGDALWGLIGTGVLLTYGGRTIYVARKHLWRVLQRAFGNKVAIDDSSEVLSYRWAVLGVVGGSILICLWLVWSGMAWWQPPFYLGLAMIFFLALTRAIVETGIPIVFLPADPGSVLIGIFGSGNFTPANHVAMGLSRGFERTGAALMSHFAMAIRVGHAGQRGSAGKRLGSLGPATSTAVLLCFLAIMFLMLLLPYGKGGLNLSAWTFRLGPPAAWKVIGTRITNPTNPLWRGVPYVLIGAGMMALLYVPLHFFSTWPLHPAGMAMAAAWPGAHLWSQALWVAIIKGCLIKYGGPRMARRARPFFLGLVIGQVAITSLWLILDMFTGATGHFLSGFRSA